jgi:hypothetical protein
MTHMRKILLIIVIPAILFPRLCNAQPIAISQTDLNPFMQVFDPSGPGVLFKGFLTGTVSTLGIYDLEYGPDGELYALMDTPAGPSSAGGVYQIDLATGTGSPIFVPASGGGASIRESELAISPTGILAISQTDLNPFLQVFDPSGPGVLFKGFLTGTVSTLGIYDLEYGPDGELYALMDTPAGPSSAGGVYQIDLATGTGSPIFVPASAGGASIRESELAISHVPEPSSALLLVALASIALGRARRKLPM